LKKRHSTTHALSLATAEITKHLNNRVGTIVVSLDVEKAFDKTWQEGVVYKMKQFDFPVHVCRVIANYLHERTFRVKVEDKFSTIKTIRAGVPQGSVLGPTLFNIYTSDIPEPSEPKTKILAYADDVLIQSSSPRLKIAEKLLNDYLKEYKMYTEKWNLKINREKSEVMKITKSNCYKNCKKLIPQIKWGNEQLSIVKKMKYLGITLKEDLTFKDHITNINKKCNATRALYNKINNNKSSLSPKIKTIFYLQVLRPSLSYGFPAWFNIPPAQMERLRLIERKCLRQVTGLTRKDDGYYVNNQELYNKAKLRRIDNFMVSNAIKFVNTLHTMDNSIVQQAINREVSLHDKFVSINHIQLLQRHNLLFDDNKIKYFDGRFSSAQYLEGRQE
jgi:hypothetical protein